jgi:very-short-patch-repair endonuclease
VGSKIDVLSAASRVFEASVDEFRYYLQRMSSNFEDRVESNIELMLLLSFDLIGMLSGDSKGKPLFYISPSAEPDIADWHGFVVVTPQYKWNGYRIDFRIDTKALDHPIFVECDGHDFHERTKEQAERDRSKDRRIQEAGIPILRFTGREIFRNPLEVVNQVTKFITERAK